MSEDSGAVSIVVVRASRDHGPISTAPRARHDALVDDAQAYERQVGATCAWVVTVTRNERVRKQMHDALGPRSDVRVVGDAVDAVAAMVICLIARPDVLIMDADLSSDEVRTVTRRVGSVSPSTWIGTWTFGQEEHQGAGAPPWVESGSIC